MSNCSNCGADIGDDALACEYCGSKVDRPEPVPVGNLTPSEPMPPARRAGGTSFSSVRGGSQLTVRKAAGGLAIFAVVGLLCGVGGLFAGSAARELELKIIAVPVSTQEQALEADGMVCVEGVIPEVAQPVRIPGNGVECLYVKEEHEKRDRSRRSSSSSSSSRRSGSWHTTDTREHMAPSFQVGELTVTPRGADFRGTKELYQDTDRGSSYERRETWSGIPVASQLTIVGKASGGTISGGDPFVIAVAPSRQHLIDQLESTATTMKTMGVLGLIVGVLAGAGAVVAFLKR